MGGRLSTDARFRVGERWQESSSDMGLRLVLVKKKGGDER